MSTVRKLLQDVSQSLISIHPGATVFTALEVMNDHDIGALLVIAGNQLVGILTERDHARKVALRGRVPRSTFVDEIMTQVEDVHSVTPFTSLEECLAKMDNYKVRHLPVIEEGDVVGIISIRDVVHGIVKQQIFLLEQFENYMSGST